MVDDRLPEYRVKARNTAAASENAIHQDDVAQRYGFPGGLVPGVTIYAYLTRPVVAVLGTAWLERGIATVRFRKPVVEGDEVRVTGEITGRDPRGVTFAATAGTAAAEECAALTGSLPAGLPTPVNVMAYHVTPLPEERPVATREHLSALSALGTPEILYDQAVASVYLDAVCDDLPHYRGSDGHVHPAFFLDQANRALDRNVRMGPWIHVSSTIRHLGKARVGDRLWTRGRIRSLYEKKGREYVELDLLILAGDRRRPVAHVLHTAIWKLPAPAS